MDGRVSIAITGTPGTGKTTLCEALSTSFTVLSLQDLAEQHGCLDAVDSADDSAPLDIHLLAEKWHNEGEGITFIDGHLSHLLEVDAIVILRCNPVQLKQRLEGRAYTSSKIAANVEWELLSGTWSELLEFEIEAPILELDSTSLTIEEMQSQIIEWVGNKCPSLPLTELSSQAIGWM
ncbi:MAG: AAA family ATPase [Candidatus Poseidoniales archaeon]|jgi:adenylate kinase